MVVLVDQFSVTTPGAPLGVIIDGETEGFPKTDYEFSATVVPTTTIEPVTYEWQATDQEPQPGGSTGLSDTITLNWDTGGIKYITVTATNATGFVTTEIHEIDIAQVLEAVEIDAKSTGTIGRNSGFSANVTPDTTTTPITYTWEATNQETEIVEYRGVEHVANFLWDVTGTKMVTVTATNANGSVSATHTIDIKEPEQIQRVFLGGRETGGINIDYCFRVEVMPQDTIAIPITYTWEATDHQTRIREDTDYMHEISFNWPVSGTKTITVTATNVTGSLSDTHEIEISDEVVEPVPLESVDIRGPMQGRVGIGYEFTAVVTPTNATTPITYDWVASGDGKVDAQSGNQATFTWSISGTQMVTVTVDNGTGDPVTDTYEIDLRGVGAVGATAEVTVTREMRSTLVFTDTAQRAILIAHFETGSVLTDTEVVVRYTDLEGIPNQPTAGFVVAGQAFLLDMLDPDSRTPLEDSSFEKPLSITIKYDETTLQAQGIAEDELILYRWDTTSEAWQDAATTCDPTSTYAYRPEDDEVSVAICRFSEFFVGVPAQGGATSVYLPLIGKMPASR